MFLCVSELLSQSERNSWAGLGSLKNISAQGGAQLSPDGMSDVAIGGAVVIDAGTRNVRIGRAAGAGAGAPAYRRPSHMFPPVVGRVKEEAPTPMSDLKAKAAKPKPSLDDLLSNKKEKVTIGDEAVAMAATMDHSWPIVNGRIKNWVR